MKKYLSLWLCLLFALPVLAQSKTSLGLRGGINFSTTRPKSDGTTAKTGGNFGAFILHHPGARWGISGEINFSSRGEAHILIGNSEKIIHRLYYVEMPVYGTFYFSPPERPFRPKVFAGAALSTLLSSEFAGTDSQIYAEKETRPLEVGALAGIGFNYRLTPDGQALHFDLRYQRGLTPVFKEILQFSDPSRNKVFSINLGMSFPL